MPNKAISRREFLHRSFAFSAAAILAGCHRGSLAAEPSKPATAADDQHLLMVGDWGWGYDLAPQRSVAQAMQSYVRAAGIAPGAMLLLGDNFYGPFKGGVECPRWKSEFEEMYPPSLVDGPCWALLGNHDYDDEPVTKLQAQLDYQKSKPGTRWRMPAKWYRFEFPEAKPLVTFLSLDSNYHNTKISLTAEEKAEQLRWLQSELEKPRTTPYLVVLGHHPLYSNGLHGDDAALLKDWEPLLKKHGAQFYFCGHDHDMQHLELENHPTSFILSGGGGAKLYPVKDNKRGLFAQQVYGFSHVQINSERVVVRHIGPDARQLHAMQKTPDGKVTILT